MNIDIFLPNHSMGLMVDSQVFQEALSAFGCKVRIFRVPLSFYIAPYDLNLITPGGADLVIFIEKILIHPKMLEYPRRILSLNPEWLINEEVEKIGLITEIWHKTKFSYSQVEPKFPAIRHALIGFTTPDPKRRVDNFNTYIHFRGKSLHRNTQRIINCWEKNNKWPPLKIQAYGDGTSIHFPHWVDWTKNISCYFGFMETESYLECATSGGIHLCLSETEAFGHYINESRAMGALTVVLDAPPMNELVDSDSGFVIPVSHVSPCNFGVRFYASDEAIYSGLEKVIALSQGDKKELGINARKRYEYERKIFNQQLENVCFSH